MQQRNHDSDSTSFPLGADAGYILVYPASFHLSVSTKVSFFAEEEMPPESNLSTRAVPTPASPPEAGTGLTLTDPRLITFGS